MVCTASLAKQLESGQVSIPKVILGNRPGLRSIFLLSACQLLHQKLEHCETTTKRLAATSYSVLGGVAICRE
eukprot:568789-Amphidinium_carterae.1